MVAALEVEFAYGVVVLCATPASPANTQSPLLQIIALYFLFAMGRNDCVENSDPAVIRSECERSANFSNRNKAIECRLVKWCA